MSNLETLLSRDAFLLSVDIRLFWFVALIYGASLVLYIIHLVTKKTGPGKLATNILWFGVITHAGLILLRTFEGQRAPFQTLYESLSWFAWSAAVTYLYVERKWKDIYLSGILVAALSMGACLYALLTRSPAVEPLSPPLQSWWFEWHVVLAFLSYAVFVVSCSIEIVYLAIKPSLKKGLGTDFGINMDNLESFHAQSFRLALFGFPLLTFGIFSGAAWANEAWGRYWGWDPKETWSLITWTVFAMYLHSVSIPKWRGMPASIFNILGFICMIMTFIGVNWVAKLLGIPSLHLYAM
ncbi:MAG: c-type cytochrome biogenesis protein CcsB [Deltaproteobacteria bacterium GWC2_42_51]|nr:MAG: c-type cytochrome biogenesis protein CcsB [Deltaproteobacteria bacterium GWC2_42_51]OGP43321.1 MAG: c-type cytochrome biogenesis protein CcsB [Deltaproteobacteria bacterium GWD2_42_10]OGP47238.1 MAG: c-type cytochrome biogenesis protein CcsB [Deltaproteobacteria bacterium GWF2_42_12]OGQ65738.1 MAG: c-type cytochrome biogenesis protein CcsB [Deltaproteobacteria bacterium RIFCSPLOWO2_12_FULL_42_16]OGQ71405.1 MAG: c-type cytochrome biogenesis protein CcsB [Deltaproteobacteria bacterium RIF